jgi:hypothetical protein
MDYAVKYTSHKSELNLGAVFYAMGLKLKWQLIGLF